MKKNVLISVIISIILMGINRLYAAITGHIIGLSFSGGECVERIGFGWSELTFYPLMRIEEETSSHPESVFRFEFVSFLHMLIIVFVVAQVICIIKSRKK